MLLTHLELRLCCRLVRRILAVGEAQLKLGHVLVTGFGIVSGHASFLPSRFSEGSTDGSSLRFRCYLRDAGNLGAMWNSTDCDEKTRPGSAASTAPTALASTLSLRSMRWLGHRPLNLFAQSALTEVWVNLSTIEISDCVFSSNKQRLGLVHLSPSPTTRCSWFHFVSRYSMMRRCTCKFAKHRQYGVSCVQSLSVLLVSDD